MDSFAIQKDNERNVYFEMAADKTGLSQQIVEKDFWVCFILKQLFSLPSLNAHLIFKGGTSLSKVFKVIERFSEDVDITISKAFFDINVDDFPENVTSLKKQKRSLEIISNECMNFVQTNLLHQLHQSIFTHFAQSENDFELEIDPDDPEGQSILFYYPTTNKQADKEYIRQAVKIEIGARGEPWPSSERSIMPIIEEAMPGTLTIPSANVRVLDAERTFWEKATILHKFAHLPDEKNIPERQSRHYFDFYKLLKSDIKCSALIDQTLLEKVANHKRIYFRAAWANYDEAKQGSLKLVPSQRVIDLMRRDYEKMSVMFYGKEVLWVEILHEIKLFEESFNK